MFLRRKEYLQPKINIVFRMADGSCRKESGQVEWVLGCSFLLFLAVLLITCLQINTYQASALYLEDALAASNLASAVIDLEEYGTTHAILVDDPIAAYERFCTAVKGNLQLNENWESENKTLISGPVNVINYTIYNVKDENVTVYEVNSGGVWEWQGVLGSVTAPNGIFIETTSIYSEITFPVAGFGGTVTTAHKGKLIDIVSNEETEGVEESL